MGVAQPAHISGNELMGLCWAFWPWFGLDFSEEEGPDTGWPRDRAGYGHIGAVEQRLSAPMKG